jgi:hypothetical protein
MPLFAWGFMALWLGMLGLFSWLLVREGGVRQFSYDIEVALLALFWFGGLAGLAHVSAMPIVRIERDGEALTVTETRLIGG